MCGLVPATIPARRVKLHPRDNRQYARSRTGCWVPTYRDVCRVRGRQAWTPPRLLLFAAALTVPWVVSVLVGPASGSQVLICDLGGPCAAAGARDALAIVGGLAGLFALVLLVIAGLRWIRSMRAVPRRNHPGYRP